MKYRLSKEKILVLLIIFIVIAVVTINLSRAVLLEDGAEIEPNSVLTYYLNVYYDGVDVSGIESNDTTLSTISSGYILVEDRIPEGLELVKFVDTSNGTIGAVAKSDDNKACPGEVVGGAKGIEYDSSTKTVKFKVKNLQAGCKLTVGVVTKTSDIVNDRNDYYNYAISRESSLLVASNEIHNYMGINDIVLHKVKYEIDGDKPNNIVGMPKDESYAIGSIVGLNNKPMAVGYTFLGWESSDVSITNNAFGMPNHNVTLKGKFKKNDNYKVRYEINGVMPIDYELPSEKEYYENDTVRLDALSAGDIINGYVFNGWKSDDVEIDNNGYLLMPAKDITLTGTFSEVTYNICYKFDQEVALDIPECKSYKSGEKVELLDMNQYIGDKDLNYLFLGYDKEKEFIMPNHDVTVIAKWQEVDGYFKPSINLESLNEQKKYYDLGESDELSFNIANNQNYNINDIFVELDNIKLDDSFQLCNRELTDCKDTNKYSFVDDNIIRIDEIPSNMVFKAKNNVKIILDNNDNNNVKVNVKILGAVTENDYYFKDNVIESIDYKLKNKVSICTKVNNDKDRIFQYHITSSNSDDDTGNNFDTWLYVNTNQCQNIYLANGNYKIEQLNNSGYIVDNNIQEILINDENQEIVFNNKFKKVSLFNSYGNRYNKVGGNNEK